MFLDLQYLRQRKQEKPNDFVPGLEIGVDQCRRGSVIGDAFVCGSTIPRGMNIVLRDSKTYALPRLHRLAQVLETACDFALIRISPELLDAENLNLLFAEAFVEILNRLKPEKAYVDSAWSDAGKLANFLRQRTSCPILIVEHKADVNYPAVSAASILCKHYAECEMDQLKTAIGDFGSGYPADPRTRNYLHAHPDCSYRRKKWKLS